MNVPPTLGAQYRDEGHCTFSVWAPDAAQVAVQLNEDRAVPLRSFGMGYHEGTLHDVVPGMRYRYLVDGGTPLPDPASRSQPEGVHGPSAVVDPSFAWTDTEWRGLPLDRYVIYELHVGTFSEAGTLDGVIPHLDYLKDLGVTAIELMPLAQFPGNRNWGYDGVFPFAVQDTYGGVHALNRLVDACHQRDLAVVLDVVYNHLGPDGNYLHHFGPYFTDRYRTPWGLAVNFDGPGSDGVRRFFIENALYWIRDCHIDALRLDAVHAIADTSPLPFLEELATAVHAYAESAGRAAVLIAESAANDPKLIRNPELGGYGLDGVWNDDFHHCLHTLLTGERDGYYADYGRLDQLAKVYRAGFAYTGEYSPFRRQRHGRALGPISGAQLTVSVQNHDQIGNRMRGDRLGHLVGFEAQKLAAAATLLAPFVPLLFMGEEYGEDAPFPYFVSHLNEELIGAVRKGRREEFASFGWADEPPDPQSQTTFDSARLSHGLREGGDHRLLLELYRELLRLRKEMGPLPLLGSPEQHAEAYEDIRVVAVERETEGRHFALLLHFGDEPGDASLRLSEGRWQRLLDTADERWGGPGIAKPGTLEQPGGWTALSLQPFSAVLLARDRA